MMKQDTTTARLSRRAHQIFLTLADERHMSLTQYLDRLAEQERRRAIIDQSITRLNELLEDPAERKAWEEDTAWAR